MEIRSDGADMTDLVVETDGSGGAIIAWADQRNESGLNYDIYAQRITGVAEVVAVGVPLAPPSSLTVWPVPAADRVTFELALPRPARVRIDVFDVAGRHVRRVAETDAEAGRFSFAWNGRDDAGRRVGAGVYVARAVAGSERMARRLVLMTR